MTTLSVFQSLAHYNRIANERLYTSVAQLDDEAYRRQRPGSFGSIHALLNHILLGDRIWMSRFSGGGKTTPALDTVLYEKFNDLRSAREKEDAGIENFFQTAAENFLTSELTYVNSKGQPKVDLALPAVLHMFNHQTHHRGQVHVMLSQCGIQPPSLDMHRILNP
jgi:uncharacterized damage-inducible protein DinB